MGKLKEIALGAGLAVVGFLAFLIGRGRSKTTQGAIEKAQKKDAPKAQEAASLEAAVKSYAEQADELEQHPPVTSGRTIEDTDAMLEAAGILKPKAPK